MIRIGLDNVSPGLSTSAAALGGMRLYLNQMLRWMPNADASSRFKLLTPVWNLPDVPPSARVQWVACPGVPRSRAWRVLYEQTVYPGIVDASGVDVYLGTCNVLPLASRTPAAVVVQSLQFLQTPESYPVAQRVYLSFTLRRSLRKAKAVIVPSAYAATEITRLTDTPRSKIHVVHHGLSPWCEAAREDIDSLRLAPGNDFPAVRQPYVLSVSSFYPYKNLANTVRAFALAREQHRLPHMLVIVGSETPLLSGARLREIAFDAGAANAIVLLGRVDHTRLPKLYAQADLFVMPSLEETFGLPLIEAMALGCPVLTSARSCMPEIAAGAGALVDPSNIASIADGIAHVLLDSGMRRRLQRAGQARSRDFSWENSASKTYQAVRAVADR